MVNVFDEGKITSASKLPLFNSRKLRTTAMKMKYLKCPLFNAYEKKLKIANVNFNFDYEL